MITDTDRRGAQVFAIDLGKALTDLGHEVRTVALALGRRPTRLEVDVLGARPRGVATLRALRGAMRNVDVTIAHGSSTLLACGLAGLGPGRPFVYRQISDSRFWASTVVRRARVAAYLRFPRRVVALSESAAETLSSYLWVPREKVSIAPNGVPRARFKPPTDDERARARAALGLPDSFIVLYIGALASEKAVHIAMAAIGDAPSIHLAIAGDGPEREQLQQLGESLAPGRVHFLGDLSESVVAYHASDVVALLSLGGDSMPATLIEAGFCALPTVTTSIGSITEIVIGGVTGIITDPGDVTGATEALERLQRDSTARSNMGRAAEHHCLDRFEIDVVARRWDEALTQAVRSRTGGASSRS